MKWKMRALLKLLMTQIFHSKMVRMLYVLAVISILPKPVMASSDIDFNIVSEYNVEPSFAKAVAVVESGQDFNSPLARNKNNIFGLVGKSFESKNDCIHYFGKLMNSKLYKNKSIDEIALIYCPHNSMEWASKVKELKAEFEAEFQKDDTLNIFRKHCIYIGVA